MSKSKVFFRANAGVKDIVGRGLIYDDNIAILELVKNAKDARSPKVIISFENETALTRSSTLTISDFGMGMTFDDIENKWLNIAYSEKKGKRIDADTAYAGNKGVGRFSCDRLGKELVLYTKSKDGDYLKLPINWEDFENKDRDDLISTIPLECHVLGKEEFLKEIGKDDFERGTILKIKQLRSEWDSRKLKKLISELEKFSPSLDAKFDVFIFSNTEHKNDLGGKLNAKINNNILEKLSFKTTFIKSHISADGETLSTSLYYQGAEVYKYTAKNPYEYLKDIRIEVHYLDTLSKSYFTKRVGVSANSYGSIFLFFNGFRISPYGNAKNDWLSLDQRKSQGTARYLGTREVFGRIDINDADESFSVVTSREGLAHNKAFHDLVAFDKDEKTILRNGRESYGYVTTIIRQLEQFVVGGLNWNRLVDRLAPDSARVVTETDIQKDPQRYQLREISADSVQEACDKILKSDLEISDFEINDGLILKITEAAEEKYNQFVDDFVEKTKNVSLENISPSDKGIVRTIIKGEQEKARVAKEERDYAEEKRIRAEETVQKTQAVLKDTKSENLFLRSDANKDIDHLTNLHHQIVYYCSTAESEIENLKNSLSGRTTISTNEVLEMLLSIENDITKISKVSGFASDQKYKLAVDSVSRNLVEFISEYIDDLSQNKRVALRRIQVINSLDKAVSYNAEFSPLEIMIIVDNLISNSRRAKAKKITFLPPISKNGLFVVSDNSKTGLDPSIEDASRIFEKGFTTTDGSGRGLHHVSTTLRDLGLSISVVDGSKFSSGLTLEVCENVD